MTCYYRWQHGRLKLAMSLLARIKLALSAAAHMGFLQKCHRKASWPPFHWDFPGRLQGRHGDRLPVCQSDQRFLPLIPSRRLEGYCHTASGGWSGGRLHGNRWTDFSVRSSIELSKPIIMQRQSFAHPRGVFMGKNVISETVGWVCSEFL